MIQQVCPLGQDQGLVLQGGGAVLLLLSLLLHPFVRASTKPPIPNKAKTRGFVRMRS